MASLHRLWSGHAELLEVGQPDLLRAELTRGVVGCVQRPLPSNRCQTSGSVKLARGLLVQDILLESLLLWREASNTLLPIRASVLRCIRFSKYGRAYSGRLVCVTVCDWGC